MRSLRRLCKEYKEVSKVTASRLCRINISTELRKQVCRPDFQTLQRMVDVDSKKEALTRSLDSVSPLYPSKCMTGSFLRKSEPPHLLILLEIRPGGLLLALYVSRKERETSGVMSMVIYAFMNDLCMYLCM
jgi:hypothetical protein